MLRRTLRIRAAWVPAAMAVTLASVAAWSGAVAAPASAAGAPLVPTLHCVYLGDPHGPLAFFGYDDQGPAVTIAAGAKNKMVGAPTAGPKQLGQTTSFTSGVTTDAFAVGLANDAADTMTWTVKGPDGVVRSATASISSPQCAAEPFTPSVSSVGGSIGDIVTSQVYRADNFTLDHAAIRFQVAGLVTICNGGGVAAKPAQTWWISPETNGTAKGPLVDLGVPPNDRDFAQGKGALKIPDSQLPPTAPYTSVGMSDGWVTANVYPQCNLGNGVVFTGALVPLPPPPYTEGDTAAYCFVTSTSAAPEVTVPGTLTTALALGDCPDVRTLPGGAIRWR